MWWLTTLFLAALWSRGVLAQDTKVLAPTDGQQLTVGQPFTIRWDSGSGKVDIRLSTQTGVTSTGSGQAISAIQMLDPIASQVDNNGRFVWTPTQAQLDNSFGVFTISIDDGGGASASSGKFTIQKAAAADPPASPTTSPPSTPVKQDPTTSPDKAPPSTLSSSSRAQSTAKTDTPKAQQDSQSSTTRPSSQDGDSSSAQSTDTGSTPQGTNPATTDQGASTSSDGSSSGSSSNGSSNPSGTSSGTSPTSSSSSTSSNVPTAALIGGILGAVIVILVILIIVFIVGRKRNWFGGKKKDSPSPLPPHELAGKDNEANIYEAPASYPTPPPPAPPGYPVPSPVPPPQQAYAELPAQGILVPSVPPQVPKQDDFHPGYLAHGYVQQGLVQQGHAQHGYPQIQQGYAQQGYAAELPGYGRPPETATYYPPETAAYYPPGGVQETAYNGGWKGGAPEPGVYGAPTTESIVMAGAPPPVPTETMGVNHTETVAGTLADVRTYR